MLASASASLLAAYVKMALLLSLIWLVIYITTALAEDVEIDANGEQQQQQRSAYPKPIHATFINSLRDTPVSLYWAGNANSLNEGALQLYYGPLEPNGGQRTIDGFAGQIFVLTQPGGYSRRAEYRLGGTSSDKETFILTEESIIKRSHNNSASRDIDATKCRSLTPSTSPPATDDGEEGFLDKCQRCSKVEGCGFALTRNSCFSSHAIATVNTVEECTQLDSKSIQNDPTTSVDAWINRAIEMTVQDVKHHGGATLRLAYRCLEMAVKKAMLLVQDGDGNEKLAKEAEKMLKKAFTAESEIRAKLEAVFDEQDMKELLDSSRHPKLEEVHPNMDVVPRRTAAEAKEFLLKGQPVVITDWFHDKINPVVHRWSLTSLDKMFSALGKGSNAAGFNVAADLNTQCCRYFESQGSSQKSGYPYPFSPTTHLYRDTFSGFVKTTRKANRDRYGRITTKPRLLHYLHEIIMNKDGKPTVGGTKAPLQLENDLDVITTQLRPLAAKQPFFGDFSYAKIWMGMMGIIMPMHYDHTDNMYVMSWGRKKAYIGKPGQLNELYRYPNGHPLQGSSQVNLTEPDLDEFPNFADAKLAEVVVGPGDILYLPALWWHQFEQPFEDTAALNIWSKDRDQAPDLYTRDKIFREHVLSDQLEEAIARGNRKEAGAIFDALANGKDSQFHDDFSQEKLKQYKESLLTEAKQWKEEMVELPGGDQGRETVEDLVDAYLECVHSVITKRGFLSESESELWQPGESWFTSHLTQLSRELRERCKPAPEISPFMSICV